MTTPTTNPHNLEANERRLCEEALNKAGTIVDAAELLGITRHALKRRIAKFGIRWERATRAAPGKVVDDAVEDEASMDDAAAERKFNTR